MPAKKGRKAMQCSSSILKNQQFNNYKQSKRHIQSSSDYFPDPIIFNLYIQKILSQCKYTNIPHHESTEKVSLALFSQTIHINHPYQLLQTEFCLIGFSLSNQY